MARLTLSSETKDLLESKSGPFFACHGWPCRKFMQILTMNFDNYVEMSLAFCSRAFRRKPLIGGQKKRTGGTFD
jgi:hypothetical protein